MKDCDSLAEYFGWLEEDFTRENHFFDGSFSELCAFEVDDALIEYPEYSDYTTKNVLYITLGHMLIKYAKYIWGGYVYKIKEAIAEVMLNYDKLELTKEEQSEMLNLAKEVGNGLSKLKIFEDGNVLSELERKEYLEEHGGKS